MVNKNPPSRNPESLYPEQLPVSPILINDFMQKYGDGLDGTSPTLEQWSHILGCPDDASITLINFFKFRKIAEYTNTCMSDEKEVSGQEAFDRYSAVSGKALERAGGHFLYVGPFVSSLIGPDEDWDLVAIGHYPNKQALINLFTDNAYADVYVHRSAACEKQVTLAAT